MIKEPDIMKKTLRILAFGFIFALTLWVGMGCSSSTTPLPSSDSQVLLEEAQKAIDAQDWETAISKLEEVLRSTPNSAKAHFLLGNVYAQQDQFTKAEEHFNKALELDPKYVDARSNLGVVYYRQGKLQEAEKPSALPLHKALTMQRFTTTWGAFLSAQQT